MNIGGRGGGSFCSPTTFLANSYTHGDFLGVGIHAFLLDFKGNQEENRSRLGAARLVLTGVTGFPRSKLIKTLAVSIATATSGGCKKGSRVPIVWSVLKRNQPKKNSNICNGVPQTKKHHPTRVRFQFRRVVLESNRKAYQRMGLPQTHAKTKTLRTDARRSKS